MRDPVFKSPMPKAGKLGGGPRVSAAGCCPTRSADPRIVRRCGSANPADCQRRCPQPEAAEVLASFLTWRDRAVAGLMLYCGLRSAEVFGLDVVDVDIGGRWLRVIGKGQRERRVRWTPTSPR
jgi:integrase/recombinase XerD